MLTYYRTVQIIQFLLTNVLICYFYYLFTSEQTLNTEGTTDFYYAESRNAT